MVASFDYAYFGAPRSAQTLFMSLRFCSLGVSSFVGIGYMSAFTGNTSSLDFHVNIISISFSVGFVFYLSVHMRMIFNGVFLIIFLFLAEFNCYLWLFLLYVKRNMISSESIHNKQKQNNLSLTIDRFFSFFSSINTS